MFRVGGRTDCAIGREAERAVAGQSGAEKVQGQLSHVHMYLTGGCKGARPSSVVPGKGQEAMAQTEIKEIFSLPLEENYFELQGWSNRSTDFLRAVWILSFEIPKSNQVWP